MKLITNEVKIALMGVLAIVVLFAGLQFLKGLAVFGGNSKYYVCFDDVNGLAPSTPVYVNGYKVGAVQTIDYDFSHPERIIAALSINAELKVSRGSRAEIVSDLLGNVKLELKLGSNMSDILNAGDTISGGMQEGAKEKLAGMVPQIMGMLPKLDSILISVNTLLADPAIASSMHNVDQITAHLTSTTRELHQLSVSLNQQLPQMMSKADGVLANTEGITRQLNEIDVKQTMQKVDATLANVEQMTSALNSKEGTMGLLLHDPSLYNNLSNTMYDADQLMIDFKQHPKRYVHFSIFGKKDK